MENKTQNKHNNGSDESQESPKYHYFISYRHLSSDNPNNSISLARSIEQALNKEGFKVFFDCSVKIKPGTEFELIKDSKYILVLITEESLKTVEQFPHGTVDKIKNGNNGYNFAKELQEIEDRLSDGTIGEENVLLLNIDKRQKTIDILNSFMEQGYEHLSQTEVVPFLTGNLFTLMIKYLSHQINGDEETKNNKSIKKYKTRSVLAIVVATIAIAFGLFKVFWDKGSTNYDEKLSKLRNELSLRDSTIDSLRDSLSKYENEFIIFAGGGTVQRYLSDSSNNIIDVKNYPFSKFVHLPSAAAWPLLWDDVNNEDSKRPYCPIILSTGKIDTKGANIEEFLKTRRIAEHILDSIPLLVQILDPNDDTIRNGTITLDSLKKLLITAQTDYDHYEIWTTTEQSGTYLKYKKLLNDSLGFNLDSIVNFQGKSPGRRFNFNPNYAELSSEKTAIFLANKYYNYTKGESPSQLTLVSNEKRTITIPLYIYSIAEKNSDKISSTIKLIPGANLFFNAIGSDTTEKQLHSDKITVIWE